MEIPVKKRIFTKRRVFIMIGILCFVEAIVLAVILTAKYTCLIYECPISWVRPTLCSQQDAEKPPHFSLSYHIVPLTKNACTMEDAESRMKKAIVNVLQIILDPIVSSKHAQDS